MKQITRDDTEHGTTYYPASEVDAALAVRDAEIVKLMAVNRTLVAKANRQNAHDARQAEVIAAQHKVLEQALEALEYMLPDTPDQRMKKDASITAIQEVL